MTSNGIDGANTQMGQMGMNQMADSYSRNIQNQIADAQKQLQELSSNKDMTQEEKMTKRQELQQQISDLNVQLRQHQMEQRREKQQKQSSFDDMIGGNHKTGAVDTGVIISLSTAKEQIAGMKKVRTDLQGKLRTAQTEEEKADLQEKIDNITQNIGDKVKATQDTISDYQEVEQDKTDKTLDKKEDKKENETDVVSEEHYDKYDFRN
ncbi:MAG: FlxA-like family protein [Lachnospiraceae bacterium]|nr:FlxA-like family protein [Lachnospiraceae bacterium]